MKAPRDMTRILATILGFAALTGLVPLASASAAARAATPASRAAAAPAMCAAGDFDGFLIRMATSARFRRAHIARRLEVVTADARSGPRPSASSIRIAGARYADFPLAMVNHHYVRARAGRALHDRDGTPLFLAVTTERQTAILTDYPVHIVNVSWQHMRYGAAPRGQAEGPVLGHFGDDGRLIFAGSADGCWELINTMVTRRSAALRVPVGG